MISLRVWDMGLHCSEGAYRRILLVSPWPQGSVLIFVSLRQAHVRSTTMGIKNTMMSQSKGRDCNLLGSMDALLEEPTEGGGKEEGKWDLGWQEVCCPLILVTLGICPWCDLKNFPGLESDQHYGPAILPCLHSEPCKMGRIIPTLPS